MSSENCGSQEALAVRGDSVNTLRSRASSSTNRVSASRSEGSASGPIPRLPPELIGHILSFLSHAEACQAPALVCHEWLDRVIYSPNFWRRVALPAELARKEDVLIVAMARSCPLGDAADAEGWLEDMRQQLGWDGSESAPPFCGFDDLEFRLKLEDAMRGRIPEPMLENLIAFGRVEGNVSKDDKLSSIRALQLCVKLKEVSISHTQISTLEPLRSCVELTSLNISDSRVDSLEPLVRIFVQRKERLLKYQQEEAEGSAGVAGSSDSQRQSEDPSRSASPDAGEMDLESDSGSSVAASGWTSGIDWDPVPARDLDEDQCVPSLVDIRACMCVKLANISDLQHCVNLRFLDLAHTCVQELSAIGTCVNLRKLYLRNTGVESISALATCVELRTLDLAGTKVNSVESLRKMVKIMKLDLSSTNVSSIDPLRTLTNIRKLTLSGCPIESIQPVQLFEKLVKLDISKTRVVDLKPTEGLSRLFFLICTNCPVEDIRVASTLPSLVFLDCSGSQVDTESVNFLLSHSNSIRALHLVNCNRVNTEAVQIPARPSENSIRVKGLEQMKWDDESYVHRLSQSARTLFRDLCEDSHGGSSVPLHLLRPPPDVFFGDWLAANVCFFFRGVINLYDPIRVECSQVNCPQMMGSMHHEYLWSDSKNTKRPVRMSAQEYVNNLFQWILGHIYDIRVFGDFESSKFFDQCKYIFKRLFRVFAHINHAHTAALRRGLKPQFDVLLKHFILFTRINEIITDPQDIDPLAGAVAEIIHEAHTLHVSLDPVVRRMRNEADRMRHVQERHLQMAESSSRGRRGNGGSASGSAMARSQRRR